MPVPTLDARDRDIAALIALWIAIHGGDPAPSEVVVDETAILLAAALDSYLASTIEGASRADRPRARLEERLHALGVEIVGERERRHEDEELACVCFGGTFHHKIWQTTPIDLPDHPKPPSVICVCF